MNNSQCIPVNELIARLKLDSTLKVLFVEGVRDLAFWRKYVPVADRKNSVVYSGDLLGIAEEYEGGAKGKLLKLIEIVKDHEYSRRIKVFVDADNDRLLAKEHLPNVVLTDYRDLESYALNADSLTEVAHTGLAKNKIEIQDLKTEVTILGLPLASLRFVSEKCKYYLPFADTLIENKRRKYIKKCDGRNGIDIDSLITSLMQNAGISLKRKPEVRAEFEAAILQLMKLDERQVLHGKDWTYFLAHYCDVLTEVAEPLIFLSIKYENLDVHPNLASVKEYLLN